MEATPNLLSPSDVETIFFTDNQIGEEIHGKEKCRNIEALTELLDTFESGADISSESLLELLSEKDHFGDSAFHLVVNWGTNELLLTIWEAMEQKLSDDQRKSFFMEKGFYSENILASSTINKDDFISKTLWEIASKLLDPPAIKQLICEPDSRGMNFLHYCVVANKSFMFDVLRWFRNIASHDELKKLFYVKTSDQSTPFHYAMTFSYGDFIVQLFDCLNQTFDEQELKEMIFFNGVDNYNGLGYAVGNKFMPSFQLFWTNAKNILTADEMEKLVFQKNDNGNMVFMHGERRDKATVNELRKLYIQAYGSEKISKFIDDDDE